VPRLTHMYRQCACVPQGLDIGPKSIELLKDTLKGAKTVIWNGPMGVFEFEAFSKVGPWWRVCKCASVQVWVYCAPGARSRGSVWAMDWLQRGGVHAGLGPAARAYRPAGSVGCLTFSAAHSPRSPPCSPGAELSTSPPPPPHPLSPAGHLCHCRGAGGHERLYHHHRWRRLSGGS
jgi:hypothetical protein